MGKSGTAVKQYSLYSDSSFLHTASGPLYWKVSPNYYVCASAQIYCELFTGIGPFHDPSNSWFPLNSQIPFYGSLLLNGIWNDQFLSWQESIVTFNSTLHIEPKSLSVSTFTLWVAPYQFSRFFCPCFLRSVDREVQMTQSCYFSAQPIDCGPFLKYFLPCLRYFRFSSFLDILIFCQYYLNIWYFHSTC